MVIICHKMTTCVFFHVRIASSSHRSERSFRLPTCFSSKFSYFGGRLYFNIITHRLRLNYTCGVLRSFHLIPHPVQAGTSPNPGEICPRPLAVLSGLSSCDVIWSSIRLFEVRSIALPFSDHACRFSDVHPKSCVLLTCPGGLTVFSDIVMWCKHSTRSCKELQQLQQRSHRNLFWFVRPLSASVLLRASIGWQGRGTGEGEDGRMTRDWEHALFLAVCHQILVGGSKQQL